MGKAGKTKRVLVVIYLLVIHAFALLFIINRFIAPYVSTDNSYLSYVSTPTEATPAPTIIPVPSVEPTLSPAENSNQTVNADVSANAAPTPNFNVSSNASPDVLMIPVVGIKKSQLTDTFSDARSEGRVHNAIDIMAPLGTPVVAAADGEIARFWDSVPGGITIYQYSRDKTRVYYYAHLQSRAANLKEKDFVTRGTVLGYVGDTGNAGAGNYHLHFSIEVLKDPKKIWEGEPVNPFPLLKEGIEAR